MQCRMSTYRVKNSVKYVLSKDEGDGPEYEGGGGEEQQDLLLGGQPHGADHCACVQNTIITLEYF